jgi:cytochrome bd-type quinol oxidase subunit 2
MRPRSAREAQERAEQEAKDAQAAAERARLEERRIRLATGFVVILMTIIAFAALVVTNSIHGKLWWFISVSVLVFACTGAACWAAKKGFKTFLAILLAIGALLTPGAIAAGFASNPKTTPPTISTPTVSTPITGTATPPSQKHAPGHK